MDINRLTEKVRDGLATAQTAALRYGHQQIDVEHLLVALLRQERGLAVSILNKADIDFEGLRTRLEEELESQPKVSSPSGPPDQVYLSNRLNLLLPQAQEQATKPAG